MMNSIKLRQYESVIDAAFPGLRRQSYQSGSPSILNQQGQNSDVLVVDGRYIFRFPKYPGGIETLRREARLLSELAGRLPLTTPIPEFDHLENQPVGTACLGHRRLPGDPLWRAKLQALPEPDQAAIAAQLSGFLAALHSTPLSPALQQMLPVGETRVEIEDLYARLQAKVLPLLSPAARVRAAAHFEQYLSSTVSDNGYTPVLRHGDFGPSNILFDPAARRISAVIDFAAAGPGDPAADFAGLLSGYGQAFLLRCLEPYPVPPGLLERIRFHQGTFALQEALFGVENGDAQALQAGIAGYEHPGPGDAA